MAIKIFEKFAPRANPADGDYPYGSIKNESVPGAKDGTPLDAVWGNDYAGFDAALLAEAGIEPSGNPDTVVDSQRLEALRKIYNRQFNNVSEMVLFNNITEGHRYSTGGTVWEVRSTSTYGIPVGDLYLVPLSSVIASDLSLFPTDHVSPTANCASIINAYLPNILSITFKSGKTYNVTETVYIGSYQSLISESEDDRAVLKYTPAGVYAQGIIETVGFQTSSVTKIEITVDVAGNLLDQPVGVPAVLGGQGVGMKLTCGTSRLKCRATYTAGTGIWISNGGDYGLYTHVNDLYLVAAFTGHEGIIFDGAYDQRAHYLESYFAWDSNRDFDYTGSKASKTIPLATICAGILFYSGSCEVVEMHPSNNRHGYAWATFGRSGDSYRLRFAHAIGEGSAGAVYLAPTDDVTGGLLNCHSTRGKFGLPLAYIRSLNNVEISTINIKVDAQDGYPAAEGGTYAALHVDGDSAVLSDVRIWATDGKAINGIVLKGSNHLIKGMIKLPATNEAGGASVAISTAFPLTNCDVDMKIINAGIGLTGASGNTDIGMFNLTFQNVAEDVSATYLGFLTQDCIRRGRWYNHTTGKTNKPQKISSGTILAADANGTNKSITVDITGKLYQSPSISGLQIENRGSSGYLITQPASVWLAGSTPTNAIIRYNIAGYSGDFAITFTIS